MKEVGNKMARSFKTKLAVGFPMLGDKIKAEDYWRAQNRQDLIKQCGAIAEEFRAHHEANGSSFASWPAAWKTWYVRAVRFIHAPRTQEPRGAGGRGRAAFRATKDEETHVPLSMVRELAEKLRAKAGR